MLWRAHCRHWPAESVHTDVPHIQACRILHRVHHCEIDGVAALVFASNLTSKRRQSRCADTFGNHCPVGDCPQLDNDSVRAAQSWIFAVVVAIIVTCGATLIVIYVRFVKQQTATSFHQMDLVYSGPHPTQLGTSQQGYEDFAEHNCECTNETPDLGKIQGSIPCNLGNSIVPSVEIKMHEIMQRLSRGTGEVARWAKTIVVGDAEHIAKHVSSFILASGQSIFLDSGQRFIDDAAEQDKAMIVCGRCGTILASKVALTPPKECFRKDLVNTGMRKESAIAMSAALRDFGVVYVASASGPMAMYLLCVGDQIWEFDLFGGRWQQKFSL